MPCADDQVTSVRRALELLDAFGIDEPRLSMAELARRTKLAKTTALRLARTLEASGYLVQLDDSHWRLGPSTAWLAARYQVAFDLKGVVYPVLRSLAMATQRNTSFFVRERDARVRLMSFEADPEKSVSQRGEQLPLDRGSPGKVILAFMGKKGKLFDEIRERGYHLTIGETYGRAASLSAPVFGSGWSVIGALTVSCLSKGITEEALTAYAPEAMRAARNLSSALMRSNEGETQVKPPQSYWHP